EHAKNREDQRTDEQAQQGNRQPPEQDQRLIGGTIDGKLHSKRGRLLIIFDLLGSEHQRVLRAGKTRSWRWKLHAIQQFLEKLIGRVGIGGITFENTRGRMIKYGVALICVAIIKRDAKEIGMILKGGDQVKTQLTAIQELVIVNRQRITLWEARN